MEEKITIYAIAEALKLSPATVSRAFKPDSSMKADKRKLILETAEKMGYVQNKMASRLSRKPINIAVAMYGRFKPYYKEMLRGIEAACRDLLDYKVNCTSCVMPFREYSEEEAFKKLRAMAQDNYDGIILHGSYGEETAQIINDFSDKGIKVATLHNDILPSRRLFTSMCNTELTGSVAAQLLDIFLPPDRRRVIMFAGNMKSLVHQTLTFSFIRHAEKNHLELLRHYATEDHPELAEKLVEQAFEENDEIDGIYISSGNSEPICRYIADHELGGRVVLIASDIFPELSSYIRRGIVQATIFQNPYGQGYQAFQKLYYHIAEGKTFGSIQMVDPQIVLKSNLPAYENWSDVSGKRIFQ